LQSLRVRFTLSHTLPILLLIPLLGILLLYLLQTRYFLDTLAEELVVQARILADFAANDQNLGQEPGAAARLIDIAGHTMPARLMILNENGQVVTATSDVGVHAGERVKVELIDEALAGGTAWRTRYSTNMHDDVVDVAVPIRSADGRVIGVVRLSQSLQAVQDRLRLLTLYIVFVFSFGILAALALALFLARTLGVPIVRITDAVARLAEDEAAAPVPETGPTEMRALAVTFNRMAQDLENQNMLRRRMLASIVHEMGRPLGGISAAAQYLMLNTSALPDVVGELSTEIVEQVQQMDRQIEDLNLLSQTLSHQIALHFERFFLSDLCAEELHHIRLAAEKKSLTLHVDTDPRTPAIVADRRRIGQIIANLLSNAVKFTPEGGNIELSIYPLTAPGSEEAVEVCIHDNGPGIDPADQEHIFQHFYRSPEQRPLQKGMGLGLAVARQLAEAHGGQLYVRSRSGAGATFYLRLRIHPVTAGAA
jgi:two-component system sensor histidine kinase BaeS